MEPSNWASAHSDALRDYFRVGLSFSRIATEINSRFGTTYTRSAVLGRARRMGLATPRRIEPSAAVPPPTAPPRPVPPPQTPTAGGDQPQTTAAAPPPPARLRCVGIRPRLISLLELGSRDCRYPYGGDKDGEPITFCGHPRRPGSSYCTPHFHLTLGPDVAAERGFGPVVLRLVAAA